MEPLIIKKHPVTLECKLRFNAYRDIKEIGKYLKKENKINQESVLSPTEELKIIIPELNESINIKESNVNKNLEEQSLIKKVDSLNINEQKKIVIKPESPVMIIEKKIPYVEEELFNLEQDQFKLHGMKKAATSNDIKKNLISNNNDNPLMPRVKSVEPISKRDKTYLKEIDKDNKILMKLFKLVNDWQKRPYEVIFECKPHKIVKYIDENTTQVELPSSFKIIKMKNQVYDYRFVAKDKYGNVMLYQLISPDILHSEEEFIWNGLDFYDVIVKTYEIFGIENQIHDILYNEIIPDIMNKYQNIDLFVLHKENCMFEADACVDGFIEEKKIHGTIFIYKNSHFPLIVFNRKIDDALVFDDLLITPNTWFKTSIDTPLEIEMSYPLGMGFHYFKIIFSNNETLIEFCKIILNEMAKFYEIIE